MRGGRERGREGRREGGRERRKEELEKGERERGIRDDRGRGDVPKLGGQRRPSFPIL